MTHTMLQRDDTIQNISVNSIVLFITDILVNGVYFSDYITRHRVRPVDMTEYV